ncbi:MAG: T9SS type A sorting domain-containing protein [Chitinophagaceae bacterium]|nr:T9SS type A sorting domain-containing protein [Chitinophagaceae bacterium]
MRQNIPVLILLPFLSAIILFSVFMNRQTLSKQQNTVDWKQSQFEEPAFDKRRNEYMYNMVKDPVTGRIPDGIIEKSYQQALQAPERNSVLRTEDNNTYFQGGALNAGGRSRTIMYDKRFNGSSNRVILAGSVSGGIFRSTDGGNSWTNVTKPNEIHNVHWIVQDTGSVARMDTWYAGGGEHWGNTATENGATFMSDALYKSIDNGATWTKLPQAFTTGAATASGPFLLERFDHPFDFVHKIAINPLNGHIYVGCHRRLLRSTDGGQTWIVVFVGAVAGFADGGTFDVVVSSTGRVIVAINGGNEDPAIRGVWSSPTGNVSSFTRLAGGSVLGVDSVDGWRGNSYDSRTLNGQPNPVPKRILLALAPSDNNIMYVMYENGAAFGNDADLYHVNLTTNTWTNRSINVPDFGGTVGTFSTQEGYDMFVAVKPDNPNFVILGGVNLFRSTDGFSTTSNTTWIGGYADANPNTNNFLYVNHHPDQHSVAFRSDNPNEMISAHDGGLSLTTNILAATVAYTMVPNYQTFQYYYVAIDPGTGRNNFAGGMQDNGTWLRDRVGILGTAVNDSNKHRFIFPALSGDGGAVGLAANNAGQQYLYGSSQLGTIRRISLPTINVGTSIRPAGLTSTPGGGANEFGEFVTNFKLNPSNTNDLYYINFNRLFRTTDAPTVDPNTWTELTGVSSAVEPANNANTGIYIRSLAFSWGTYQASHVMYIGTTDGRVFRLDDPRNAAASQTPVNLAIPAPFGANIQDIAVNPNNDNEIMAVVSNYEISNANVTSVWWTNNAKSATPTWVNAEGNMITAASVRSCAIVVKKDAGNNPVTEYYIGTSVGLFSVVDNTPATPPVFTTWFREVGTTLNLPIVQSLAYRPVDNVLLVGTHGNGMYFAYLGTPNYTPNQATGINDPILNDKNFISKIYPTVSSSRVDYQTGNRYTIKTISIQLLNANGQIVYKNAGAYQNGSVDISKLAKGVYVLSIISDDRKYKYLQKIIKQ